MSVPFRRIRFVQALAIVAIVCLGVRLNSIAAFLGNAAQAEEAAQDAEAESPPENSEAPVSEAEVVTGSDAQPPEIGGDEAKDVVLPNMMPGPVMKGGEKAEWKDSADFDLEYSKVEENLYKDLTARRDFLDKREKELALRQALLEAAERELDQKINEMNSLKSQIESLLQAQSDEEKARTQSLVKIYEGMKAKDAANIFNDMEDDVLLEILSNMSERKSAPIIAEMDPDRARMVTILLSQQKKMPVGTSDLMNTQ